jgi:micrococcal nuclease
MPLTGYDRDAERLGFPRGPRWRRVLTLAVFLLALSAGALLRIIAGAPPAVVDGDTVKLNGHSYRLLGFDTPETYFAKCETERQRGEAARARLKELIATRKTRLEPNEKDCKWNRECARLFVDGEDVGAIMIREGHALPYAGRGPRTDWCK